MCDFLSNLDPIAVYTRNRSHSTCFKELLLPPLTSLDCLDRGEDVVWKGCGEFLHNCCDPTSVILTRMLRDVMNFSSAITLHQLHYLMLITTHGESQS